MSDEEFARELFSEGLGYEDVAVMLELDVALVRSWMFP